jgi:hypothetical protein
MRALTAKELLLISGGGTGHSASSSTASSARGPASVGVVDLSPANVTAHASSYVSIPATEAQNHVVSLSQVNVRATVHEVQARSFTSKDAHNNPGDLMHSAGGGHYVLNTYVNEQDGREALAALLDSKYTNSSTASLASDGFNKDTAANPNQAETETSNLESYMAEHGYPDSNTAITNMSADEFNTFLDAVTNAEGRTNM